MAIHINPANKGKFNALKKRTGKTTEQLKHSKNPLTRKRATFALNAKKWKHEDGGLVQYGWGGSIASAGAVASMIPTPWTQIGGAALSMIGGIVGGQEEKKLQEEQLAKQAQASADIGQAGIRNPYQATFADGGVVDIPKMAEVPKNSAKFVKRYGSNKDWSQFTDTQIPITEGRIYKKDWLSGYREIPKKAMGGAMMPSAEVEGGEVVQSNSGEMKKINGPKHSQGGVQLMMENGGRVFSDKIINPQTGNTFAKDADRLRKMMK